jgi:ABC-2 type transport system permease protein
MVRSPELRVETTRGPISVRVRQQLQALVYALNRQLQSAYIASNLEYVRLILHGGSGDFLGRRFNVLGLDRAAELLATQPQTPKTRQLEGFVHDALLALSETGNALRATANPIQERELGNQGRSWALSADVQAYALALTVSFLALVLAAASLAGERDENVIGRLTRGLVSAGELVWAKVVLAAGLAAGLGLAIALAFGAIIELQHVTGGEPWQRIPVLFAGLVLAGGALGALGALLGALSREARSASLVALLVVLPIVFLGLVPREVVPAAGWASEALPFTHAVHFFSAALYNLKPWGTLLREGVWLVAIGTVFGFLARLGMRRLST